MGLSDKFKKLKADVKKINTSINVETKMSKILKALEGKRCTLSIISKGPVDCKVINVDDEWMEVKQFLKKDQSKTMIIRIKKINDVAINVSSTVN
ncbi:hypothetical protein E4V42_23050 [Clostridium estertheticum]|uniref:Uncharacterized protein n=1 Tax=Clostridium estertheticum TaxID=238834 RepID=A0A5N7J7I0_9CLOT|nr:hypothetical protein [Clostridium estertheticum]MPQ34266.1 hypothetical protein [Clostridium estertheticum]MPQ64689.1 hypothetical protein [Clostridium estertheticum]